MPRTLRASRSGRADLPAEPLAGLAHIACAGAPHEDLARLIWLGDAREIRFGRGDALEARPAGRDALEVAAPDARMSARHARLMREGGEWMLVDEGSTNGTFLGQVRVTRERIRPGRVFQTGYSFWKLLTHVPHSEAPPTAEPTAPFGPTRTVAPVFVEQLRLLDRIAPSRLPVLVLGETGTGKEIAAHEVHARSRRRGEFRAINCAAIPATLVEAELLGHKRGAFTGADEDRAGLVEAADGGTLFLDEIGDLPADAQAKVLRVIETGEVVRVGDTRVRHVDVRLVAATHRELGTLVRAGRFREDLLARLAGFVLRLPPLRDRIEDIGVLLGYFLRRFTGASPPRLEPAALRALLEHSWPFNVRELGRAVERAALLSGGARDIRAGDLLAATVLEVGSGTHRAVTPAPAGDASGGDGTSTRGAARQKVHDERRARVVRLLGEQGGNVSAVARAMGVSRMQVHRWMKRYGIG